MHRGGGEGVTWRSVWVAEWENKCIDHNLKSVSIAANILPLHPCHSHILFPSHSHTRSSLQLRINFSVSICLVPLALLSSPLNAFLILLPLPQFPFPPSRSQSYLPLDLFWRCCCMPLVNVCSFPLCTSSALVSSASSICLFSLRVRE